MKPNIYLKDITMRFPFAKGMLTALENTSLEVADGEFVSLIGPSGCGKSTLLRIVSDIYQPSSGTVEIAGVSAREARINNVVTMMFQESVLLPWLNVYNNVLLPCEILKGYENPDILKILEIVGLQGREKDYPYQLSGGMQQRVALARALVTDPEILLMDEPFASIDELTRDKMGAWLLDIWNQSKKTVLFVTHSIPEAVYLSDRVVVMDTNPGRIRRIINIDLPRPREDDIRQSMEYYDLLNELRAELRATGAEVED